MAPTLSLGNFSARILPFIIVLWLVNGIMPTTADPAKDRDECAEQLAGLATCLPYVSGQAKAPTPDCCSGLKQVLKNNKKCLCVIIRDRNDPDLGLQINVNLALALPSVCHAPANVSKCPELLNMDPHSPEAQVFYQLDRNTTETANSPSPSPTAGGPIGAKSKGLNSGSESVKKRLGWKVIIGSVLLLKLMQWFM